MLFHKRLVHIIFLLVMTTATGAQAECDGFLDLTNGYRHDKVTAKINAYDPPGTLVDIDDLKAKNMDIYQLGLKGKWACCDCFMRIEGEYGWGSDGKYTETSTIPNVGSIHSESGIHKVRVKDFSVAGGYLCPLFECFSIGPVAGWSYHSQRFKLKNNAHTDGIADPILNGLKYSNRWQGPWAGVDLAFYACEFTFNAGYEYHWAHWHADWTLDGPDVSGAFSDRRKSTHAHGQVVYLDARWNYCSCWNIGLGLKFQEWRAIRGREKPQAGSFAAVGLSNTEVDKVKHATWCSFAITADIGYTF